MLSSQIITIDPGGVGRVRSRSIEFSDNYLHKPVPTDPIFDARMIENIIGDKEVFAIEYSISDAHFCLPYAYGECRIWLGENCLGGIEGEVYLTRVGKILQSVYLMIDKLTLPEDMHDLPDGKIFKVMQEDRLDEKGNYWFMYTEGFDLMSKYVYYRNDTLFFLWQYCPDAWDGVRAWGFPGQLFSSKVPISIYMNVTNKFKEAIDEIYPSN
jgi:hypothetical protein